MSDSSGQGDGRVLSAGSQGLTSDPRPSSFLGSWTKPGAQRPASVGTAGTVLPRGHYPGQPPRYVAGPQEMGVGPPEACLGQAKLRGGDGGRSQAWLLSLSLSLIGPQLRTELRLLLLTKGEAGSCAPAPGSLRPGAKCKIHSPVAMATGVSSKDLGGSSQAPAS